MLTEISIDFPSSTVARKCLTAFRKKYRVALRGAVAEEMHKGDGTGTMWRLMVPLGGTGFSRAEFTNALESVAQK